VHLAIVLILLLAGLVVSRQVIPAMLGAGGAGPAGGGGGGRQGTGGVPARERLEYIDVSPSAPEPRAIAPQAVPPPKTLRPHVEQGRPVIPPPAIPPSLQMSVKAPDPPRLLAMTRGVGGGAGNDGSRGAGPGTGGGVGTGAGTGRGSATGPGTGGGTGTIYPPTPDFLLIPPLPRPDKLKGKSIVVTFIIDATGKPERIEFESTGDGGYDRLLREKFSEFRFRPAHRADGTPVPSRYVTEVRL
jgi:protein TonB